MGGRSYIHRRGGYGEGNYHHLVWKVFNHIGIARLIVLVFLLYIFTRPFLSSLSKKKMDRRNKETKEGKGKRISSQALMQT